ncbi:MAG: hypothetical protein JW913_15680 [Chitinispirillaceae bacterium]|nr:hypothetical protein [Chitinispirillaceae bacterium]
MDRTRLLIVVAAASFTGGLLLYRFFSRMFRRMTIKRRFSRAAEGEADAEAFLRKHGYRIIEQQAQRRMRMLVDGETREYDIRADFIAEKRGRKYVVEVKTGEKAIDPASIDTRRQLLEYAVSYAVDAVYLFNAGGRVLHEISLPAPGRKRGVGVALFTAGAVAGATVVLLFLGGD